MRRIAMICAEARRYNEALEVARVIGDPGVKVDALVEIGAEYLRNGLSVDEATTRILHQIVAASE